MRASSSHQSGKPAVKKSWRRTIDRPIAEATPGWILDTDKPFRLLVEAVKDYAIFLLDANGRIISWNAGAERIKGYSADEIIGQHFSRFYTEEDRARNRPAHILAAARTEGRYEDEGWRVRKDGTRFWADVVVTALYSKEGGRLRGFAKITRDLTEKRHMDAMREREALLHEFLAMLSHELRNPLAPIANALALLPKMPAEQHPKLWSVIDRQISHLTRLVDDLLDVSRVTRRKVLLKRELLDLNNLAGQAIETCQPLSDAKAQTLEFQATAEVLPVSVDPTRIVQAISNLVNNSVKYTAAGGRISVATRREGDEALVRVTDTGIGIPAALLPKVFDVFVQGDRSLDRSEGGLGIGLTVVKSLVEMHGGSVSAFSDGVQRGSEFVIRLPLADERNIALARPKAPLRVTTADKKRLLVVDDNRDFAATLATLLEVAGHEVRTVHNGAAALPAAAIYRPHAVLMDIGLPGMSGYEVAKQLRSQPEFATTLLIALTGYGQEEDRLRLVEAGFNKHLVKPISPTELLKAIDQPAPGGDDPVRP
ncbi:MAG TPA: ATP-binding protein [Casimicrobiaceae bacterium]|nr:ATP-binding protein [Casimicrobiaceae bacterium]